MGKKSHQSEAQRKLRSDKSVNKTVNTLSSDVNGGKDFSVLSQINCIYTNADSFMNKFDEFKTRFINEDSNPQIIMVTEVLPKNCRYSPAKAEFNIDGYDLFPEKLPAQDSRGILIYIKQELKAVEITLSQSFKEYVLVKINLKNNDKLLVGCIYKSPSSTEENHCKLNELLLETSNLADSYTHIYC